MYTWFFLWPDFDLHHILHVIIHDLHHYELYTWIVYYES